VDIAATIKSRRIELGLTLEEVGDATGVKKSTVMKWETGAIKNMRRDKLARLAYVLRLDPVMLMQTADEEDDPKFDILKFKNISALKLIRVPVLGNVAAGKPIFAEQDYDAFIPNDMNVKCDFALKVKGHSMYPTYHDGDWVYIRETPTVDDGAIAVVIIEDEAALKHVYRTPDGLRLVSDNPDYPPLKYDADECEQIHIAGKPVAFLRNV
jgi:repressor LexA